MTNYILQRVDDSEALAYKASKAIANHIKSCLMEKDRCQVSLAGGSTPARTYSLLGVEKLSWYRVDVFLGDERWVAHQDSSSNTKMIKETLLSASQASKAKFHISPTVQLSSPQMSADYFADLVENICSGNPPVFDLIVLGLGDDGHTASLFPFSDSLHVNDRSTTVSSGKGIDRISLTYPVINSAKKVFFLVGGENKQIALKRLLDPSEPANRTPAKLIQTSSEITVFADEAATGLL